MEEKRVLRPEKSRRWENSIYWLLFLIFGATIFNSGFRSGFWWSWPAMAVGCVLIAGGVLAALKSFSDFSTVVIVYDGRKGIIVKKGKRLWRVNWNELLKVEFLGKRGEKQRWPGREIVFIGGQYNPVSINPSVFSPEDDAFLVSLIKDSMPLLKIDERSA